MNNNVTEHCYIYYRELITDHTSEIISRLRDCDQMYEVSHIISTCFRNIGEHLIFSFNIFTGKEV